MKKEKKPSIYSDRTAIGSPNELDEYGIWVKSAPQDMSPAAQDTFDSSVDISGFDDMALEIPGIEDLPDFDQPEIDIGIEEDGESDGNVFNFGDLTGSADSSQDSLDSTDSSFDDFADFQSTEESMELPSFSEEDEDTNDSDLSFDLDEGLEEISVDKFVDDTEGSISRITSSPSDLSTQLLMKIAEELASIRDELSSLKKEFSGLKSAVPADEAANDEFYDGEDDKIALTGDELNNILNTADFTEESGSDATGETLLETATQESDDDDTININDLDMEIDLDEPSLDELESEPSINLGEESDSLTQDFEEVDISMDNFPDFDAEDTDELQSIIEDGVEPMTPAPEPEDENYLAEDPLTDRTDDFSEAVIDEPDLSSEIQDNPLEEPSLDDISISLDMSEMDSAEFGSEELSSDELGLDELDSEDLDSNDFISRDLDIDDEVPSLIPENFTIEAEESQPPIEESEDEFSTAEELDILGVEETPVPEADIFQSDEFELTESTDIPSNLKQELKTVLSYMDQLLDSLPDEKIEEFAQSDYYDTYKKLFKELEIV